MRLPNNNNLNIIKPEDNSYLALALIIAKLLIYRKCLNSFPLQNKLFKHIYANSYKIKELITTPELSK
jgi:hypothetical protein